jgi:hypothetical protein
MRHAPHVGSDAVVAVPAELAALVDVEQPRLDDEPLALDLERSLDQRQGADDRPVVEVDLAGGDARGFGLFDVGGEIDDVEEAAQLEIAPEDRGCAPGRRRYSSGARVRSDSCATMAR